jgi:site-specific recombinase XerD
VQKGLERFLKTKKIEGCTQKTLNAYRYEIERFIGFLRQEHKQEPCLNQLTRELVEDWLASRELETTTRARMLASLKSYARFLTERNFFEANPLESLKTPRVRQKVISFLTAEEFQKLLADARQGRPTREIPGRDYAILALFVGSGIRISELAGLKINDVDLHNHQIKVQRKGGKGQYIPIGPSVIQALRSWLSQRGNLKLSDREHSFFVSNRRRAMSEQTIRNVVKKWMKHAGLWGKKMSPHTLRHSYATAQIAAGTPVQIVQNLLGHNQLNTTSKYLHIVDKEYKKAANKIEF